MDSLSLDNFRQQQDYQRALFVPSRKKHHKKHHHKHKSRKHRSSRHHHSHRSKRSSRSKTYGSVTDQCAVCLDDETELDTRLFPCKHAFHGECLIEWVKQGENFTCPLCRQKITHFFNLSPNKEINDELVSIWNDYYVNIDSLDSSTTEDDKAVEKSVDGDLASKSLSTISDSSEVDDSSLIEEIAKLKNKEVNEALGIVVTETELQTKLDTQDATQITNVINVTDLTDTPKPLSEIPVTTQAMDKSLEKERESIEIAFKVDDLAPIESSPQENGDENGKVNKMSSVWNSMWSTIKTMKKSDIGTRKEETTPLVKLLLPNNGIASAMFDEDIKHVLISSEQEETEMTRELPLKNITTNSKMVDFDVGNEIERINESMGTSYDGLKNGNFREYSQTDIETKNIDSSTVYADILEKVSVRQQNETLLNTTSNMEAGIYAGIAASLVTYTLNHNQHRMMPYLMRGSLLPTMKQTIPNVCAFFTIYEHLKSNVFGFDDQSYVTNFGERFLSAGIASSVAFLPRNQALTSIGLKFALPLRFATFFGSFEFCKDITLEWKYLNGNIYNCSQGNALNLVEIAASAGVGSIIASGIHYPITQFIQHGSNILNHGNVVNGGGSGSGGVGTASATTFFNANKNVIFETMYRGWMSHLARFVPTTVACSCAFEFGKRAVCQRKD